MYFMPAIAGDGIVPLQCPAFALPPAASLQSKIITLLIT
jgi:hypothetical protein